MCRLLVISLACLLAACAGPEKPLLERIVADCRSGNADDKAADFRCRRQAAEEHDLGRADLHGDLIELTFAYLEAVWRRRQDGAVSEANARLADLAVKMRLYDLIRGRADARRLAAADALGDDDRLRVSCVTTPSGYRCR